MSEGVAREIGARGALLAWTIVLKLRYEDFATMTRQTTLRVPDDLRRVDSGRLPVNLLTQHWDSTRRRSVCSASAFTI